MSSELKRILSPAMIWGLGVGYVISGNYFGWNLGLEQGGTLGLAVATAFVIVMYITFTYSYAELACAIPKAGGAFDYATRALGKEIGFFAGMAQSIEFIFAPPAIAFAVGSYMNLFFPVFPAITFSIAAYVVFTGLNIYGIQAAATFELFVTVIAVSGLIFFAGMAAPHAHLANLSRNVLPNGVAGIFAAVPFAIWFFLGIEGVANLAEETVDPRKAMSRGFLSALFTLVALCVLTFTLSIGTGGWEAIVYQQTGVASDSPLPLAIGRVHGQNGWAYNAIVVAGIFGLVASLNGLMLAAGRSSYEFAKSRFGSRHIGKLHPGFKTPANALVLNMGIGILALLTGHTGEVITISVFGALTLYCISMIALLTLRRNEPQLTRPFKVPLYPYFPIAALVIAVAALLAVAIYNPMLSVFYLLIIGGCYGIFRISKKI
ncbi:MAG TPA: ethanolamine permease [Cyclobacteriaceae bacterium]|nr:ethanolamine permease [Cyclobacteriaceae bacterium]